MESSIVLKQFAAGEQEAYGGLAGITFRGTSNPEAQVPEDATDKCGNVNDYINCAGAIKKAFVDKNGPEDSFRIVKSSWEAESIGYNQKHGLSGAMLTAYNDHHAIVLKPDSFWQAILTQFGFYVTANSEQLRDRLVDFKGKIDLEIVAIGDYADFANRMVDEKLAKNIKDTSIADWLIPNFTTTTPTDRVTACVSVMSAMQNFFSYFLGAMCGLPEVTLLGEVSDWEILRAKIDRLLEFEIEGHSYMQKWHTLLAQVLDKLVESASGSPDLNFWETVIKHEPSGSGPGYFTGWMSTFNVFTSKGKWQGDCYTIHDYPPETTTFPVIDPDCLSRGLCQVPVNVEDAETGEWVECQMFAGSFRTEIQNSNTFVPTNDWFIAAPNQQVIDAYTPAEKPKNDYYDFDCMDSSEDESF